MNKIETPGLFLDALIRDTWNEKIQWEPMDFEYGFRYLTTINIENTSKYLAVEVYEMGASTFVKTDFHADMENKVHFDNIKYKEQIERLTRLLKAIKDKKKVREILIKNI